VATRARRDIELALSVTTTNTESIKALRDDVQALAKEGGGAEPEFTRLAAELDKLARQAKELESLDGLTTSLRQQADAQRALAQTSGVLTQDYAQLGTATKTALDALSATAAELAAQRR
jgi:uncharacterized protein HemY